MIFIIIIMLELKCWERTILKVLRYGHIPKHIGFIMDGNRRFAKEKGESTLYGHEAGTRTLKKCLLYSL